MINGKYVTKINYVCAELTKLTNMNAKELRIGNLVNTYRGVSKIHAITIDDVVETENGLVIGESPIPLTKEALLNFGFIEFNGWFFLENRFTTIYISPLTGHCSIGANEEYDLPYKLLYVHQLQNLYFALTGEELKSTN